MSEEKTTTKTLTKRDFNKFLETISIWDEFEWSVRLSVELPEEYDDVEILSGNYAGYSLKLFLEEYLTDTCDLEVDGEAHMKHLTEQILLDFETYNDLLGEKVDGWVEDDTDKTNENFSNN